MTKGTIGEVSGHRWVLNNRFGVASDSILIFSHVKMPIPLVLKLFVGQVGRRIRIFTHCALAFEERYGQLYKLLKNTPH